MPLEQCSHAGTATVSRERLADEYLAELAELDPDFEPDEHFEPNDEYDWEPLPDEGLTDNSAVKHTLNKQTHNKSKQQRQRKGQAKLPQAVPRAQGTAKCVAGSVSRSPIFFSTWSQCLGGGACIATASHGHPEHIRSVARFMNAVPLWHWGVVCGSGGVAMREPKKLHGALHVPVSVHSSM